MQDHILFTLRMRRLSDSARVRLAAKTALGDKGYATVGRVEEMISCSQLHPQVFSKHLDPISTMRIQEAIKREKFD